MSQRKQIKEIEMSKTYQLLETGVMSVVMIKDVEEDVVIASYNHILDTLFFFTDETLSLRAIKQVIRNHYKDMSLDIHMEGVVYEQHMIEIEQDEYDQR